MNQHAQGKECNNQGFNLQNKGANSRSCVEQGKAPIQSQNNPYAKPTRDLCYCFTGRSYKSNVSPIRRVVAIAEEREKEDEGEGYAVENDGYSGIEFA